MLEELPDIAYFWVSDGAGTLCLHDHNCASPTHNDEAVPSIASASRLSWSRVFESKYGGIFVESHVLRCEVPAAWKLTPRSTVTE